MAEMGIRKKKPKWPWVVLGLVLLALIIYLLTVDFPGGDSMESIHYMLMQDQHTAFHKIEAITGNGPVV